MKPINILVIGTGMYVCGRGTEGYGTIMPAICEWKKEESAGNVYISATNQKSIRIARGKIAKLQRNMNVKFPVKYFTGDIKEAIQKTPKPACAIVVVPDDMHRKIAGLAIEKGLHTLVVKPLAPTTREVNELVALQKRNKVHCAVEFHKRFDLANLKLKDAIAAGKIGDPLYFLVEYSQKRSVPSKIFKKWVKKTNVFQYLGIHYADIIYFATKAIPKRAMAVGQKGWLTSKGINTYDSIQGVIEWKMPSGKNFTSYILTNWIDPEKTSAMSDQTIKVIGTEGRFESDQKNRGITIVTDEKGIEQPNPYFCAPYGMDGNVSYRGYGIESVLQFLKDVIQIENKKLKLKDLEGKRATFKESVVPTAVLEAINKSLKGNGKWVTIHGV